MNRSRHIWHWLGFVVAIVALIGFNADQAMAAGLKPDRPARATRNLERAYRNERKGLLAVSNRLARADLRADRLDDAISRLDARGEDTSTLKPALAAYRAAVATARTSWDAANATLAAHAGFDDQGRVTDAAAARVTVDTAHRQLQAARDTLRQAQLELQAVILAYRQTHRDAPELPDA